VRLVSVGHVGGAGGAGVCFSTYRATLRAVSAAGAALQGQVRAVVEAGSMVGCCGVLLGEAVVGGRRMALPGGRALHPPVQCGLRLLG
jgi:hypothetical protein